MKIPRMQWVIAGMLFLATMINYADRLALGVISVEIRREFTLTETDYSHIVTLFMLAYAIMYPGSGYLVDRLGTRRGFAVFIFGWSVAQMLHAATVGKWSLGGYRFLPGLTEPANWPAAAKAVAEWFPPARRALGVGIFNAGSSLGSAIAPPMVAILTTHWGWRSAFLFTGAMGLIWLVFWLILYQPPHKNRFLRDEEYAELKDHVRPPEEPVAAARGGVVDSRHLTPRLLRAADCAVLHGPGALLRDLLAPGILAKRARIRPRDGRKVCVGSVHFRRYRLHYGRLDIGQADGARMAAAEGA